MIDYINEDHGLETIQHNFSAEVQGRGIHSAEGDMVRLFCTFTLLQSILQLCTFFLGGDKTNASSTSIHGKTIDTAYDLYIYLKEYL